MSEDRREPFMPFFGEQNDLVDCHVDLRISGEHLVPGEITSILGIEPTRAWAKGDGFQSKGGTRNRPWGMWHLTTQDDNSKSLESHCERLLGLLKGREGAIKALVARGDVYVDIAIWLNAGGEPTGFQLRAETLRELSTYCESIAAYIV